MQALFKALSMLPLRWLHAMGAVFGWLAFALSPSYRTRFKTNAALAGISQAEQRAAIAHAGRMLMELPKLWFGKPQKIDWHGRELIDAAHSSGRGIIFLTPHLGCFEVTAQAYAAEYATSGKRMTVLYRPAKKSWMQSIVAQSRIRPGLDAAPASLSGVKTLVKALRTGQSLGMLPDQVPPKGLGVWASFFGQDAYTMTLPARLALQTGAALILAWGERLPKGSGYRVHLQRFEPELSDDNNIAAAQINATMERLVMECPEQYLWGYARYKSPAALQSSEKGLA